ncbi:Ribosomal RNA small subunit methyltransferase H [Candidatus Xiphinematobacter sp. Idaho Grape]|uniref:16S rRNA (cytosine(1402)-N(4))-methyltransferase RsmH n=1 Tax=Candidatus Xiphinematobacter sp. Idaho Grape TaxID=1704307 RepID=UPI0007066E5B|nr:16S rRNA (cytosine(1402)-N(4))-methyltransferase RsmH [Candidatus Xiphinematobacter sp. Idaho Grape]ALJ56526.1 Ribosomal RNA small subunit methyltransferase H [Candidatus Xiphinematobacter sp. Idaho Grape]
MHALFSDCLHPTRLGRGDGNVVYHTPVLVNEVVDYLRPSHKALILDGTLGGGGHSASLLRSGASIIAVDQDPEAITYSKERLARYSSRIRIVQDNFRKIHHVLCSLNVQKLDGALLDVGVSSRQLENPNRGFAILKNGPLDMRMDPLAPLSAADIVNTASLSELAHIFREYGQEPHAFRIASRLVVLRSRRPVSTTFDLVSIVKSVVSRYCHNSYRPVTRVFQALRIAVNDELGALQEGLSAISSHLAYGARFTVITFHSLEDRIVKHFFLRNSMKWINYLAWPAPRPNPYRIFRLLTPHPIRASREEIHNNPRARSAKLRVVESILRGKRGQ